MTIFADTNGHSDFIMPSLWPALEEVSEWDEKVEGIWQEPSRYSSLLCCVLFFFSVGNLGGEVRCSENVGQLLYVHWERNLLQEQTRTLWPDWWRDRQIMRVDGMSGTKKQIRECYMERRWFLWNVW